VVEPNKAGLLSRWSEVRILPGAFETQSASRFLMVEQDRALANVTNAHGVLSRCCLRLRERGQRIRRGPAGQRGRGAPPATLRCRRASVGLVLDAQAPLDDELDCEHRG